MTVHQFPSPTNEEDGKSDEEQEDMGNQIKSVYKAAIVEHAVSHTVGIDMAVIATKRHGHATTQLLHTSLESICNMKIHKQEEKQKLSSYNTN